MFRDDIRVRYPWARIATQLDELHYELSRAEDEEDVELSMLRMLAGNKSDFRFFTPREQRKVRALFAVLVEDTQKHGELLREAMKEIEAKRKLTAA